MPSNARILSGLAIVAGVLAVLYGVSIAHQLLLGVGAGVACFVVAALLYAGGTNRETVAAVAIAATVVYGAFTFQLPAAMVAACAVYLTLWVTDPDGPFDATPPRIFPADALGEDAPANDPGESAE